ncbi:hypothetical protein [Bradyrhizobium sp. F1.13.3]|uniref:hypothetical protein n=1 Tax=Bradyrhizobium sp. F1.13.3 TaxID=3156351 RepID=UPI003391F204
MKNGDGTYALPVSLPRADLDLFNVLVSNWVTKPAFSGQRLCDDFFATLKSNGLISKSEATRAPFFNTVVQLFAIASIHGSEMVMSDGTSIRLRVAKGFAGLSVHAAIPVTTQTGVPIFMTTEIFSTELDQTEHCDPDLNAREDWDGAVELCADRKLHFLG